MVGTLVPRNNAQDNAMDKAGFLPVSKAAQLARVSRSTLYRWIAAEGSKLKTKAAGPSSTVYVSRASLISHLGPHLCKAYGLQ